MSKQQVDIIIDIHEPPEITEAVDLHPEVKSFGFDELPAGDLDISGIGFERKTVSDYASSLLGGRLKEQCIKLGQRYDVAYLLVEGDLSQTDNPLDISSEIPPESLRGSMASLTAREDSGVQSVMLCSNSALLVDMAVRLARKNIEENSGSYLPSGAVGPNEPVAKMMYGCIDGVGPETAEALYERWPTISEFVQTSSVSSLKEVRGIGEKRAVKIMEALI